VRRDGGRPELDGNADTTANIDANPNNPDARTDTNAATSDNTHESCADTSAADGHDGNASRSAGSGDGNGDQRNKHGVEHREYHGAVEQSEAAQGRASDPALFYADAEHKGFR
jgi:hypothetical protein